MSSIYCHLHRHQLSTPLISAGARLEDVGVVAVGVLAAQLVHLVCSGDQFATVCLICQTKDLSKSDICETAHTGGFDQ